MFPFGGGLHIPLPDQLKKSVKREVIGRIEQVVGSDVKVVDYYNAHATKKAEPGMVITMYDGITVGTDGNYVIMRLQNGTKLQLLNRSQMLFHKT